MRRPRSGEGAMPRLEAVRDIVEIVAILAAGAWAFYTFVYQNDIKPSTSPPIVQYDATLIKLGQRHGFTAVRSHITIKDDGVTDVYFYGFAETIVGLRVTRQPPAPVNITPATYTAEIEPNWRDSEPAPVYAFATLTKLGQPSSRDEINLEPGQSIAFDRLFFVPSAAYDQLQMHLDIRYAAHPDPLTVHLVTKRGIVHLAENTDSAATGTSGTVATLSMW